MARVNGSYTNCTGTYVTKGGRNFIKVSRISSPPKYISRARHIIEQELGRELLTEEVVHHLNGDCSDDSRENLLLLSRKEHNVIHGDPPVTLICPVCGKEFQQPQNRIILRIKRGTTNYVCSLKCSNALKYKTQEVRRKT